MLVRSAHFQWAHGADWKSAPPAAGVKRRALDPGPRMT